MAQVQCPNGGGYKVTEKTKLLVPVYIGRKSKMPLRHMYSCVLCGYNWHLDPGDPPPPVNARPDLIAKGEQRLQAEAAAEAQQQAAQWHRNAGHYYFEERQRKK